MKTSIEDPRVLRMLDFCEKLKNLPGPLPLGAQLQTEILMSFSALAWANVAYWMFVAELTVSNQ